MCERASDTWMFARVSNWMCRVPQGVLISSHLPSHSLSSLAQLASLLPPVFPLPSVHPLHLIRSNWFWLSDLPPTALRHHQFTRAHATDPAHVFIYLIMQKNCACTSDGGCFSTLNELLMRPGTLVFNFVSRFI